MRGDLASLLLHLVQRLVQGGSTHRQRTRAEGSHAERDLAGIAVHDFHVAEIHAQAVGGDLGEGRLVTLAVTVRAGQDLHAAGRIDPHGGDFIQTRARAQLPGRLRGRRATGLDVETHATSAQPPPALALPAAHRELVVGVELHGEVETSPRNRRKS